MDATTTRLLSLRARVLRAREQARLLQDGLPSFVEEMGEAEVLLTRAWRLVSDVVEVVAPQGANDTDEDVEAEQKRIAAELKRMERAGAMKGIEE